MIIGQNIKRLCSKEHRYPGGSQQMNNEQAGNLIKLFARQKRTYRRHMCNSVAEICWSPLRFWLEKTEKMRCWGRRRRISSAGNFHKAAAAALCEATNTWRVELWDSVVRISRVEDYCPLPCVHCYCSQPRLRICRSSCRHLVRSRPRPRRRRLFRSWPLPWPAAAVGWWRGRASPRRNHPLEGRSALPSPKSLQLCPSTGDDPVGM